MPGPLDPGGSVLRYGEVVELEVVVVAADTTEPGAVMVAQPTPVSVAESSFVPFRYMVIVTSPPEVFWTLAARCCQLPNGIG